MPPLTGRGPTRPALSIKRPSGTLHPPIRTDADGDAGLFKAIAVRGDVAGIVIHRLGLDLHLKERSHRFVVIHVELDRRQHATPARSCEAMGCTRCQTEPLANPCSPAQLRALPNLRLEFVYPDLSYGGHGQEQASAFARELAAGSLQGTAPAADPGRRPFQLASGPGVAFWVGGRRCEPGRAAGTTAVRTGG